MMEVLLVLLALPAAGLNDVLQQLKTHGEVVSTMGPRLLVVRVPPDELPTLSAQHGVQAVIERDAETAVLEGRLGLNDTERLFATAWVAQGKKAGPRSGAGLDWDAPGYDPPDDLPR